MNNRQRNQHLRWTQREYDELKAECSRARFQTLLMDIIFPLCDNAIDALMTPEELLKFSETPDKFPYLHVVLLRQGYARRGTADRFYDAVAVDRENRAA